MFEWLKRELCNHGDMEIIEEPTYIVKFSYHINAPQIRKYLVCRKCGYRKKISKS